MDSASSKPEARRRTSLARLLPFVPHDPPAPHSRPRQCSQRLRLPSSLKSFARSLLRASRLYVVGKRGEESEGCGGEGTCAFRSLATPSALAMPHHWTRGMMQAASEESRQAGRARSARRPAQQFHQRAIRSQVPANSTHRNSYLSKSLFFTSLSP